MKCSGCGKIRDEHALYMQKDGKLKPFFNTFIGNKIYCHKCVEKGKVKE